MIYCPNPDCAERHNVSKTLACLNCGTNLLLQGRYQLIEPLRKLSTASSTEIFTAQDFYSDVSKVIKVLRVNDRNLLRLFDREATVLQEIKHPGIPKIENDHYFSFRTNAGLELKCLVMEKIAGINLEQWLQENHCCPADLALQWLKQLIDILEHLHQHQWFHRDIKPTNIILKPDGQMVLIDFGAAQRITINSVAVENLTAIFTLGYAPPEQIHCQAVPQSDFYALGRTFVHLLTGQSPVNFAVDHGQLQWRDPELRSSPKLVADLVDRLMTTMVAERPQSAAVIRQELEKIEYSKSRLRRLVLMILIILPLLLLKGSNFRPLSPFITYGEKTLLSNQEGVIKDSLKKKNLPAINQRKALEALDKKKAGMAAFAEENYQQAIIDFNDARELRGSDPEIQIFLHNAKVLLQNRKTSSKGSQTIAITISTRKNLGDLDQLQDIAKTLISAEYLTDANMKIALVQEDNHRKTEPNQEQSKRAAQDLAKQPDVVGVIGPTFRQAVLNTDDVYCSSKLVNIALVSRAVDDIQKTKCQSMFHMVPNERAEMQSITQRILHKAHYKKVAIFSAGNPYSQSVKSEFKNVFAKNSEREVIEIDMNDNNFNPRESIQQVLRSKAEAIVIFPFFRNDPSKPKDQINLDKLTKVLQLNRSRLPVFSGTAAFDREFLKMIKSSGGQSNKITIKAPCCSNSRSGHWQNILAQDALQVLMTAWQKKPTKAGIQQVLSDPNFNIKGKSGQIRFSADGDRIIKPEFVQVLPNSRSREGYYFLPLR